VVVAFLALTIQTALLSDFLLTVIECDKKPGLMSYYATGTFLVGVGPAFMLMTYILIINCRGYLDVFWVDLKRLKD